MKTIILALTLASHAAVLWACWNLWRICSQGIKANNETIRRLNERKAKR